MKPLSILVAMDSFKGSLGAHEATAAVCRGLASILPDSRLTGRPMADGGEGTARVFLSARSGAWIPLRASGPLPGMEIEAGLAWLPADGVAVVECASASGLALVPADRRDPLLASTSGTGELILEAARLGAHRILLGLGGSATVDGGTGAAEALGFKFLDRDGWPLTPCGANLAQIEAIVPPEDWLLPPIEALCDVRHRLTGQEGAAAVFGPQKGATPEQVELLDAGLEHLARVVERQFGRSFSDLPGSGAAGGLAFGAAAFFGANLVPGARVVSEVIGLADAMEDVDWVVTGEGRLDETSFQGKTVEVVNQLAHKAGARVAVVAGSIALRESRWRSLGIDRARPLVEVGVEPATAIKHAEELLESTARDLAPLLAS